MRFHPGRMTILMVISLISSLGAEEVPAIKPSEKERAPVVMEAFKVDGNYIPKLSFGLALEVWKDNDTQKVISIYVSSVRENSPAQKKGLVPRTRIYRIDGTPVEEFTASFFKGMPLNKVFVQRYPNSRVKLEVAIPGEMSTKVVTLEEELGRTLPGLLDRHQ
ncbi:MAG: hypothetical protein JWM35_1127 [Verrucomicrobia bacterium]|nr:hypothetical protein [Verrucomicrobiota bacterium]